MSILAGIAPVAADEADLCLARGGDHARAIQACRSVETQIRTVGRGSMSNPGANPAIPPALRDDPNRLATVLTARARHHLALGNREEAIGDLERALRENGRDAEARTLLAEAHGQGSRPGPQQLAEEQRRRQLAEQQAAEARKREEEAERQRALVQRIQKALAELDYEPGPADGEVGQKTRDAIERFQRERKLRADGQPSEALLASVERERAERAEERRLAEIERQKEERRRAEEAKTALLAEIERCRATGDPAICAALLERNDLTAELRPGVLAARAAAHRARGDTAAALADLGEALRLRPREAGLWRERGDLRLAQGALDDAARDYRKALELDRKLAAARSGLDEVERRLAARLEEERRLAELARREEERRQAEAKRQEELRLAEERQRALAQRAAVGLASLGLAVEPGDPPALAAALARFRAEAGLPAAPELDEATVAAIETAAAAVAEERRLAELARREDERRQAEAKRQEELRLAEQRKREEEARLVEAKRQEAERQQALLLAVETRLVELGYPLGNPDGLADPRTERALAEFRRKQKLPAGPVDTALLARLDEAAAERRERIRLAELQRQEEERRKAEELRLAELARQEAAERRRQEEERQRALRLAAETQLARLDPSLQAPDGLPDERSQAALAAFLRRQRLPADTRLDEGLIKRLETAAAQAEAERRRQEELRLAEERRREDERRQVEAKRQEELRLAELARQEEERRRAEETRLAEQRKREEEERRRREELEWVEIQLAELGYALDPPDGQIDPKTRAALDDFRRQRGLEPGDATDATLVARLEAAVEERHAAERRAEETWLAEQRKREEEERRQLAEQMERLKALPEAAGLTAAATDGSRVALVIGNGRYEQVPFLPNPPNDAADVAATLERLGFKVIQGLDLDLDGMQEKLRAFGDAANAADVAFVYYAGHGIQVQGENYLIPVDAQIRDSRDVRWRLVALDYMIEEASRARKGAVVAVDACRDNPFRRRLEQQMALLSRNLPTQNGLAAPTVSTTTPMAIIYATQENEVASDGLAGQRNSPFATALLKHLPQPELDLQTFVGRVVWDVRDATRDAQAPAVYYPTPPREPIYLGPRRADPRVLEAQIGPDEWRAIRRSLRRLFLFDGLETGGVEPKVRIAISRFQRVVLGQEPTGVLTPEQRVVLHREAGQEAEQEVGRRPEVPRLPDDGFPKVTSGSGQDGRLAAPSAASSDSPVTGGAGF